MYGCAPDKIWSIERGGKTYRLTFSKSLAEHIACRAKEPFKIERRTFVKGRELSPGEQSRSGLYAIVDRRKGLVLRISMYREIAELMGVDTRYVAEAWLS